MTVVRKFLSTICAPPICFRVAAIRAENRCKET